MHVPPPRPVALRSGWCVCLSDCAGRPPSLPTRFGVPYSGPSPPAYYKGLRRVIAARKDRKVRVAPSRSPRASARRRGALQFTPHFRRLVPPPKKRVERDQELRRPCVTPRPNRRTPLPTFCSPVRAPKRSRAGARRPPRPRDRERPARSASYDEERDAQPTAEPVRVETRIRIYTRPDRDARAAAPDAAGETNLRTRARRPSRRAAPSTPSPRACSPRRRGSPAGSNRLRLRRQ